MGVLLRRRRGRHAAEGCAGVSCRGGAAWRDRLDLSLPPHARHHLCADGRRHLERARELYDPEQHSQSKYFYGQDIGATALSYLCWALWHLGYVDQAAAVAVEAKTRAEASSHPFTLAYTICHARGMMD